MSENDRVHVFGQHEEGTLRQLEDVASRAERAALMADGHFGYIQPVGGVTAYDNKASVVGVGFDVGCGNCAIRTDVTLGALVRNPKHAEKELNALADSVAGTISFGIGRKNRADDAPTDHPLFHDPAWDAVPAKERKALRDKARGQLGTVGSGNHYVDVFADRETGRSGSASTSGAAASATPSRRASSRWGRG